MTTVYINIIKGVAYSDSRRTTTREYSSGFFLKKSKRKILKFGKGKKIFTAQNSGVVCTGEVCVSLYFKNLFEKGQNPTNFPLPEEFNKSIGSIKIFRPGYVISISTNNDGKVTKRTIINDNMICGSGGDCKLLLRAQGHLWRLTKEQIEKVLHLNSLFDVYSDDNIVSIGPEDYRGAK